MNDPLIIIVGAGLAGLFTALLASGSGRRVLVIAEGRGSLSLSHGCIDIFGNGSLTEALAAADDGHPLRQVGLAAIQEALTLFLAATQQAGLPYASHFSRPLRLPTATGSIHATTAAPFSLANGSLDDPAPIHAARLAQVRDFSAGLMTAGLRARGLIQVGVVDLNLPGDPPARDLYAHDLAVRFDDPDYRQQVARAWAPRLRGVSRLGVPAFLGLQRPVEAVADLESRLGISLFEVPTLPPSVPGLRLERALRTTLQRRGVEIIEGPAVRGEVDARSEGRRASGVVATTAGGPRRFRSDAVVLATGGALHGGWLGYASGEVQDSVFGLPLAAPDRRERWAEPDPFHQQNYSRIGLRTDVRQRPVDARGRPYFENVFAVGGILAGADRTYEGSRQGIDLASALVAARELGG